MRRILVIGDKAYSSWSLRGWLLLEAFGVPFEERLARMFGPEFDAVLSEIAPARTVPALIIEDAAGRRVLWDSLAIAEHLAEAHPDAGHWPADPAARDAARALAAEMHSSFGALRSEAPMNMKRRRPGHPLSFAARADIARIEALWAHARAVRDARGLPGPYLFGAFSAADAFYAPIVSRFETYGVALSSEGAAYAAAVAAHPAMAAWRAAAEAQPWIQPRYHFGEETG
ncbi:MAG: glutathione S-transferase family protein [Pseudomonadota bacterium]